MEHEGKTLPTIKAKRDKPGLSEHMEDLCRDRLEAVKKMDIDLAKELNKEIYKQRKREQQSTKTGISQTKIWTLGPNG